jgi:DNA-binding transcriptional ArsR family regulator
MRDFMLITKALADASRIRTLAALRPGELCVCQITELLELAPSTMSKHLSILHQAGLVNARKEGRWIYYSLPGKEAAASVRSALEWVLSSLRTDPSVAADAKRLKRILAMDPAELCKRQCRG